MRRQRRTYYALRESAFPIPGHKIVAVSSSKKNILKDKKIFDEYDYDSKLRNFFKKDYPKNIDSKYSLIRINKNDYMYYKNKK